MRRMGNRSVAAARPSRVCSPWALAVATFLASMGCTHTREAPTAPELAPEPSATTAAPAINRDPPVPRDEVQVGYATWYGRAFAGRRTASGERFDPRQMTAAHRTLPFGTWVEVKRVETGDTVRVRITDRGPWGHEDRIIDLSRAAALKIGFSKQGLVRVEVRVVPGP
jgi:rare lipoprotein A